MTLPRVLAGPIARRLEPRLLSVWVALSEPGAVHLAVWPGPVTAGTSGTGVFEPGGEVARGSRRTVRVGANLHVAVVTATTGGNAPLLPGTRYSYNLVFNPDQGQVGDLRSAGLLGDRPEQPAIGYQAGVLPSVATCPVSIDELVLLHGSCNRIEALGGPNVMFAIDTLIEDSLDEPAHRPHQLWLTGDQVYADEIPAPLSPALTALGRELIGVDELIELQLSTGPVDVPLHPSVFPAGYRKSLMNKDAKLTSSEAASHLLGISERMAMQLHLWSPEVWHRDQNGAVQLATVDAVYPGGDPPLPAVLAPLLGPAQAARAAEIREYLAAHLTAFDEQELADARRQAGEESELVLAYAAKVGVIRRALANVATYFVFDDHDVTDDWNLCQVWRDRVLGNGSFARNGLGRALWRDGLVAFALTQAWGNDPQAWDAGPQAELLDAASRLFPDPPAGSQTGHANPGPVPVVAAAIDHLLGFDGTPQQIRWDYQVDGATHRAIACDTRTRRGFTGPTSPPIQLPPGELERQIPEGPLPAGLELLVVVLSQPALDPVLLGELTQALISDTAAAFKSVKDVVDLPPVQAHAVAGLSTLDYEGWGARPREVVRLLDRLATYPRVLIMSGDVHFGVSLGLSYWRHNQGLVSIIGQFTSSAVQYITFPEWLVPILGQTWINELAGRGYPFDMLVWRDPPAPPLDVPTLPGRGLRRRLLKRPVMLPTTLPIGGWPADAAVRIPPDAAWRLQLLDDARPDVERPSPVRAEPLPADFDATDPLRGPNGYSALARRHTEAVRRHTNTRRISIYNKIARLTFRHVTETHEHPDRPAHDPITRLVVRSEMFSIDHHRPSPAPPEPFTVHELLYDEDRTVPEPTLEVSDG